MTKVYASCPGWPSGGGGGYKSTSVKHKQICILYNPPTLQHPTYNWSSVWKLAGLVHENGQPLTTQSVQYHRLSLQGLSGTISFRLQGELHVSYLPGQDKWRVGSNVYVWNVFVKKYSCLDKDPSVCSVNPQDNSEIAIFMCKEDLKGGGGREGRREGDLEFSLTFQSRISTWPPKFNLVYLWSIGKGGEGKTYVRQENNIVFLIVDNSTYEVQC